MKKTPMLNWKAYRCSK